MKCNSHLFNARANNCLKMRSNVFEKDLWQGLINYPNISLDSEHEVCDNSCCPFQEFNKQSLKNCIGYSSRAFNSWIYCFTFKARDPIPDDSMACLAVILTSLLKNGDKKSLMGSMSAAKDVFGSKGVA